MRIINTLKGAFLESVGFTRWVNDDYFPNHYMKEVMGDISLLRDGLDNDERWENSEFMTIMNKYKGSYCPSLFREHFSFDNQLEYFRARIDINEIMEASDAEWA